MTKFVREFVEVPNHAPLSDVIDMLVALRDSLPEGAEPEMRMRGDDVFGRRLSISYLRPQTVEEAECDARCERAVLERALDAAQRDTGRISLAA